MKILYFKSFNKELSKIKEPKLYIAVESIIECIKQAETLSEIPNTKKLKGDKRAYRIRLGDYRIGFLFEAGTISIATIAHRKEIYKKFP